jgi:predicted nucleotidyltransferase
VTTTSIKKIDKVDKSLFKEIVKRILSAVQPEKIILFGSFAHGKPTAKSDLDILVIMNSQLPKYKRAIPIYKALTGILIPKDIVVYAPEEIEEWENVPQAFITTAVREGKVLYEKEQS